MSKGFMQDLMGIELEILYPPYCEVCGSPIPDSFAEKTLPLLQIMQR
jgi:hypothetical protein